MREFWTGFLVMLGIGGIVLGIINHYLNRELKETR